MKRAANQIKKRKYLKKERERERGAKKKKHKDKKEVNNS